MKFIEKCHHELTECLHNPVSIWAKITNALIAFLIVLSVATIPAHFIPDIDFAHEGLEIFDKIVVSIFTIEYFLRIWTAKKPFRYIFSWWGLVDLLAILPFYLGQIGLISRPELFLGLRILRLFKLGRIYTVARSETNHKSHEQHGKFHVIPGEIIKHIAQRHWTVYVGALVFPMLLTTGGILSMLFLWQINIWAAICTGGLFTLFALALFMKLWLDFNYDLIYITNRRVVFQRRELFGANLNEVNYIAITNIKPDTTGFVRWMLRYGDIIIETSAMQGAITFKHASEPFVVVDEISKNRQEILQQTTKASSVDPLIIAPAADDPVGGLTV